MKLVKISLLSFLMVSCASLSKEECTMGNWYEYGSRDANNGKRSSVFAKHAEACADYGVTANKEQYMSGFDSGLKIFCTPENAYTYGLSGKKYNNTCPADMALAFRQRYQKGAKIYNLKREIESLESTIDSLTTEMTSSSASRDRRTAIVYEIREKERKKSNLEKKLLVLELKEEMSNK